MAAAALTAALQLPVAARAQSVDDNATLQSDDAFGRSVGGEKTGLYTSDEVRGFNPTDAGNARLEGLYIDYVDRLPGRLRIGETIRVGLSAQRFPFPAPTGLVDFELAEVGDKPERHLQLELGSYLSPGFRAVYRLPLAEDRLGLLGGGAMRKLNRFEGGTSVIYNYAGLIQTRPFDGAQIALYYGGSGNKSEEARATVFQTGDTLPPEIPRRKFLGQKWTGRVAHTPVWGGLAKLPFGESWRVEAGLFHMQRDTSRSFADVLTNVAANGDAASRTIIADKDAFEGSLSGELRLAHEWTAGAITHSLTAGLRGRHKQRRFGGAQRIALGPSSAVREDFRPEPALTIGPKSHDDVKQLTYGLAYNLYWKGRANFDASVSKTNYKKRVDFADRQLGRVDTRDGPVVWNVAGSVAVTRGITLFAGLSHGMEEALIAPDIAVNRDEAPPAIHTRQVEAGVRIAVTARLGLVVGAFSINKPYYNLDPSLRFRKLGNVRNRGIEFSLTGQVAPGVTVVAGTLLLDPEISGEAVGTGLIGPRPVGQARRRSVVNLDWRLDGGNSPLSLDLAFESFSSRVANTRNTLSAPGHSNVNLGARYRFSIGKTKFMLRPQITNVFNSYGWNVSPSGGFTYVPGRAAEAALNIDF